jgi:hypothetical protein
LDIRPASRSKRDHQRVDRLRQRRVIGVYAGEDSYRYWGGEAIIFTA